MQTTAFPEGSNQPPNDGRLEDARVEAMVAPLISRANLLRVRGQWEEAVAVCTEALRRSPGSAAAHAMLGDIYAAQNRSEDALHWYRMAMDRDPNQPGVPEKLQKLRNAKRASRTVGGGTSDNLNVSALAEAHRRIDKTAEFGAKPPSGDRTAVMPAPRRAALSETPPRAHRTTTAERTFEWLDRVFPPGRSDGMAKMMITISSIVTVLVLCAGAMVYLSTKHGDPTEGLAYEPSIVHLTTLPNVHVTPPTTTATTTSSAPDALLTSLKPQRTDEISVTAAQTDAQMSEAQIEIALPPHAGENLYAARVRVLSAAAQIGRAAITSEPTIQRLSIRVLMRSAIAYASPSDTTEAVNANLVFIGETTGPELKQLSDPSFAAQTGALATLFSNTWWSSSLGGGLTRSTSTP